MLVVEVRANTWLIPLITIAFLSFGKVSINIYCKTICWVVILVVSFDWHFVFLPIVLHCEGQAFQIFSASFSVG